MGFGMLLDEICNVGLITNGQGVILALAVGLK
jgi:hypothetical protein